MLAVPLVVVGGAQAAGLGCLVAAVDGATVGLGFDEEGFGVAVASPAAVVEVAPASGYGGSVAVGDGAALGLGVVV